MTVRLDRIIERVVLKNVTKTFGATAAVRNVNLVIDKGQFVLIEGANGSGKSTLLRIMGTIMKPTSGTVNYEPMGSAGRSVRSQIGWLSHQTLAYDELSGEDNLRLVAKFYGRDPEEAWQAARDRFKLGSFASRPLGTNSRGQRQRIALSRALLSNPSLLLLDEPCTGLDTEGTQMLLDQLRIEREAGTTIVVVSHDPKIFIPIFDANQQRHAACRRIQLARGAIRSDK